MDDLRDTLEMLVDRKGLAGVVEALAEIADEKAEHVRSNWQDEPLAKAWERDAWTLKKAAAKLEDGN